MPQPPTRVSHFSPAAAGPGRGRWWALAAPLAALLLTSPTPGDTSHAARYVSPPSPTWVPLPAQAAPVAAPSPASHEPTVRVLLKDGQRAVRLAGTDLAWRGPDGVAHPAPADTRVTVHDNVLRMGSQRLPAGARFASSDGRVLLDGRPWPGEIRLAVRGRRIEAVNLVGLERYVEGVVAAETPPTWGAEVKKAQAVAVRSYTISVLDKSRSQPFDLVISSLSQLYTGRKADAATRQAVEETRELVVRAGPKVVTTYYHSVCGGHTEPARGLTARAAGVKGVVDPWCARSPGSGWRVDVSREELAEALAPHGLPEGVPISAVSVSRRGTSGPVDRVTASAGVASVEVPAVALRDALGPGRFKSTRFTVTPRGGGYTFEGRGFGHRSGLCQWGAFEQARASRGWRQILAFYFPGTRIEPLPG